MKIKPHVKIRINPKITRISINIFKLGGYWAFLQTSVTLHYFIQEPGVPPHPFPVLLQQNHRSFSGQYKLHHKVVLPHTDWETGFLLKDKHLSRMHSSWKHSTRWQSLFRRKFIRYNYYSCQRSEFILKAMETFWGDGVLEIISWWSLEQIPQGKDAFRVQIQL